jgi:hypothetical protein
LNLWCELLKKFETRQLAKKKGGGNPHDAASQMASPQNEEENFSALTEKTSGNVPNIIQNSRFNLIK